MVKVLASYLVVFFALSAEAQSPLIEFFKTDQGLTLLAQEFKLNRETKAELVSENVARTDAQSRIRNIILKNSVVGPLRITVREPLNQRAPLPLVYVVAGLDSKIDTIDLFPPSDRYILAVFEYPVAPNSSQIQYAAQALRDVPRTMGQIAVGLKWFSQEPRIQADRINVLMVSFGTLVGPAAMRIAKLTMNVPVYSNVLAYGGADIKNFVLPHLERNLSAPDYKAIAGPLSQGMDFIDPKHHLPYLSGPVLIINGQMDSLIPEASSQALIKAAPRTAKVIELPVDHIQAGRKDIVKRTYDVINGWYGEIKALN